MTRYASAVIVLVAAAYAYHQYNQKDLPTKIAEVDALLSAYQTVNQFNGAVLVARDGEVLLRKGYGLRNVELQSPHDAESVFRIYSITKPFTSTAVFKLVEQGKLSLDDNLSDFYPEIPHADKITIHHLLTHTSGLYEFTREQNFSNSEANLVELLKQRPPDFPAGESWSYCNSGYCMLGHIIAKVSEMPYETAVETFIFDPLEMSDSGFGFDKLESPEKALGYSDFSESNAKHVTMESATGPFAAGAIYSTVDDLWRFHVGLRSGKIIRLGTLKTAQQACETNNHYGSGWQLGKRGFLQSVVSHSGGATGFRSNYAYIPRTDTCVIVLNNHENSNPEFLTNLVFDVLDGIDVSVPSERKIASEDLKPLIGFFDVPEIDFVIGFAVQDGRLAINVPGQPVSTLLAQSETVFTQPEANARIEFLADEDGQFNEIEVQRPGRTMRGRRIAGHLQVTASATAEFSTAFEEAKEKTKEWHEAAFMLVHLHAQSGDIAAYRKLCRKTITDFADSESPQIAERTVKMCLFTNHNTNELTASAGALADRAFESADDAGTFDWGGPVAWRGYLALSKGMADYRRGDFATAIKTLHQASPFSSQDIYSESVRDLCLAMAHHQSGNTSDAERLLEMVVKYQSTLPPVRIARNTGWNDRVVLDSLAREATNLIRPKATEETE